MHGFPFSIINSCLNSIYLLSDKILLIVNSLSHYLNWATCLWFTPGLQEPKLGGNIWFSYKTEFTLWPNWWWLVRFKSSTPLLYPVKRISNHFNSRMDLRGGAGCDRPLSSTKPVKICTNFIKFICIFIKLYYFTLWNSTFPAISSFIVLRLVF